MKESLLNAATETIELEIGRLNIFLSVQRVEVCFSCHRWERIKS